MTDNEIKESHEEQLRATERMGRLDSNLFIVVSLATFVVFALLGYTLSTQLYTYHLAIDSANKLNQPNTVLAYARSADFVIVKLSALFLGFVLAFFGSLYVLRTATSAFKLTGKSNGAKGSLETSSPGLVMLVVGAGVVICSLFSKNQVKIEPTDGAGDSRITPVVVLMSPSGSHEETGKPFPKKFEKSTARQSEAEGPSPKGGRLMLPPFDKGSIDLNDKQKQYLDKAAGYCQADKTIHYDLVVVGELGESMEDSIAHSLARLNVAQNYARTKCGLNQFRILTYGKIDNADVPTT